jgi:hypothetical protein
LVIIFSFFEFLMHFVSPTLIIIVSLLSISYACPGGFGQVTAQSIF